jgi:hypothetical protein
MLPLPSKSTSKRPDINRAKLLALSCGLISSAVVAPADASDAFPKIGLMFASGNNQLTPLQVARYGLIVDSWMLSSMSNAQLAAVRQANPNFIGLQEQSATYINHQNKILTDPGFSEQYVIHYAPPDGSVPPCDRSLRVGYPNRPDSVFFWNLANATAVQYRSDFIINAYNQYKTSHPYTYDGFYVDGTLLAPPFYTWYAGSNFDIDCDGIADSTVTKNQAIQLWQQNTIQFIQYLRNGLPDGIIVANDIKSLPVDNGLGSTLNGINNELDIVAFLANLSWANWKGGAVDRLAAWNSSRHLPPVSLATGLKSNTGLNPTAAQITAGKQDYKSMRFGLATALLSGSYYVYDYNAFYAAQSRYWYDEYDNAGTQAPGYLGTPAGAAYWVDANLQAPNLLSNPNFSVAGTGKDCTATTRTGVASWCTTDTKGLSQIVQDCGASYNGGCSARIGTTSVSTSVQLRQVGTAIVAGHTYTLSFWAKAEQARPVTLYLQGGGAVGYQLLTEARTAQLTTNWQAYSFTLHANGITPATLSQISFAIAYGAALPKMWIAGMALQEGEKGVYRRDFENGTALVNSTGVDKTIGLGRAYYHINGTQDTSVNNGQSVDSVKLGSHDGVILLNSPTPTP